MDFEFASVDDKCKSQVEMADLGKETGRIPELAAKLYHNLLPLTFGLQKSFCCESVSFLVTFSFLWIQIIEQTLASGTYVISVNTIFHSKKMLPLKIFGFSIAQLRERIC